MAYLNENETLERDKETLGCELGTLYNTLKNVMLYLQSKFQLYDKLYGTEFSIKTLNNFSSEFFGIIQDILFDDIILHLNKLFDSSKGKGDKKVLNFNCLLELITEETLKVKVKNFWDEYNKKCEIIKTRRNKYIAHFDYDFFLEKKEYDISIEYKELKEIIKGLWDILDIIEGHYFNVFIPRHVFSNNLEIEGMFQKMLYCNKVGLKKLIEIANQNSN